MRQVIRCGVRQDNCKRLRGEVAYSTSSSSDTAVSIGTTYIFYTSDSEEPCRWCKSTWILKRPSSIAQNVYLYVVWQKSNETDFLLTINFILFTNQGYALQNSSLGQLHSDGGVVSIVRSSAGRLLLVYLSARRYALRILSKVLKWRPFKWFLSRANKKKSQGLIRRIGELRNHRNVFFCQKFIDRDCRVTWGVVVVQHPSACNTWSHTSEHLCPG